MAEAQDVNAQRLTLVQFWRKLGHLTCSDVPVLEALDAIAAEMRNTELSPVLAKIKADIRSGRALSRALEPHVGVFSPMTVCLARAGELKGQTGPTALRIAEGLEGGTISVGQPDGDREPAWEQETEAAEVQEAWELTQRLIRDAVESRASDVHIEAFQDHGCVRYRIDGVLHEVQRLPSEQHRLVIARIKMLAGMDVADNRKIKDGRIMFEVEGREFDLRVSVCPYMFGESAVLRILDKSAVQLNLERFGLLPDVWETLDRWCRKPYGIILVTGPTGSGKTTTLYALLEHTKRPEIKMTTVENPVEFILDGICQCEVREQVGMTFPTVFRSQLRQDPDVMMIGEIRDLETMQISIQAALTGHLLFTTLHTNDAPSALRRMLDMGVQPFLVNNAIIGVKAQRLCRKLCEHCKEPYAPSEQERNLMGVHEPETIYQPKGCDACHGTGYRGRIALSEIFEMNDPLREAVERRANPDELRRIAVDSGMRTMREDGLEKVRAGVTSIAEVQRVTGEM